MWVPILGPPPRLFGEQVSEVSRACCIQVRKILSITSHIALVNVVQHVRLVASKEAVRWFE